MREREALTWRALEASEVERRQIASDLHDGVVQELTGVAFGLSAMARQPAPAWSSAEIESAATSVRDSVRDLRSLVVDLAPASVQEQGLLVALEDMANRMSNGQVAVTIETDGAVDAIGPGAARILYRVALEGLRNVIQHAAAMSAQVSVSLDGGRARLDVTDDGRGLRPGNPDVTRRLRVTSDCAPCAASSPTPAGHSR